MRWQIGERLYLTEAEEREAMKRQEDHRESSPMEGPIADFIDRKVPEDWDSWPIDRRRDFWAGLAQTQGIKLVERTKICAMEVWLELYLGDRKYTSINAEYRKIKPMLRKILAQKGGWKEVNVRNYNDTYGQQRAFVKVL